MSETKLVAELTEIKDAETGEVKIYIRFTGEVYKDGERYVRMSPDEFNALVKLFVDKIVSKVKEKNKNEPKQDKKE